MPDITSLQPEEQIKLLSERLVRSEDALKNAQAEFEQRIQERTAALAQAVEALQTEVAERRRAMEQIRLQVTALEAAADGFLITDREGVILWSNPAFERMTGYRSAEILGKTPRFLKSGLHPPAFFEGLWSTILSGKVWFGETINRRKDGDLYIEEQTIAPLIDENGHISHFIAVKHDVTGRKNAENLIAENAARIEALAEISRSMVEAKLDFQATLNVLAQKTASLIGDACVIRLRSRDRSRSGPIAFYHPNPEFLNCFEQVLKAEPFTCKEALSEPVLKIGQPLRIGTITSDQLHTYIKPEYIHPVESLGISGLLIVPLRLQGELIGTLALFRTNGKQPFEVEDETFLQNVADRAALAISNAQLYHDLEKLLHKEQAMRDQLIQAEKLAAMGRMMASVAHELNNPLQTIKNCLFLIQQETPPDAVIQDYLSMATSETQRISSLVMQLREIYRPKGATQMAPVELNSLMEEIKSLLLPHVVSQKVEWQFFPASHAVLVNGIADQLKQVFLNLCFNAIEAMQPAGGTLTIAFVFKDETGRVGITIQDTGSGIPPENISKLFDPFFTTKVGGTGLGLSISFEIVQRHGGYINVESHIGHGAIFTVWLPNFEGLPD